MVQPKYQIIANGLYQLPWNIDVGAKVIERNGIEFFIRGFGFIKAVEDLSDVATRQGKELDRVLRLTRLLAEREAERERWFSSLMETLSSLRARLRELQLKHGEVVDVA